MGHLKDGMSNVATNYKRKTRVWLSIQIITYIQIWNLRVAPKPQVAALATLPASFLPKLDILFSS
jgi:hypothetical protein